MSDDVFDDDYTDDVDDDAEVYGLDDDVVFWTTVAELNETYQ